MSAGEGDAPVPVAPWNLDVEPGDPVDIFGNSYVFERVDPDHAVTFRAAAGSDTCDFMVEGSDGRPRKPFVAEIGQLMASDDLIWREKPLSTEARRFARAQEHDAKQARAIDPLCQFRTAITRRFDDNPWSKSDRSLTAFMEDALADPVIAAMPGAWPACPATVRAWLDERGEEGCRKERDGISMTNRMPRIRSIEHPLEIVFHHATRVTSVRGSVRMNHDLYVAELKKINTGKPLTRRMWINPDGSGVQEERPAEYPVPAKPYEAIPYLRFWRLCRDLKTAKAHGLKRGPQAEYQRYGGGGSGDLPTHLGALCWIDSSEVPKAFFVDDDTGIPIGLATMTLLTEHRSNVVPGWDLCAGGCSSSAIMRTVLCANKPKDVPADLLKIDANLTWLRLRPGVIRFDNATETHGRTIEDNLADAYIGTDFVGSKMPRDKNVKERIMGTFQDLLFKHMADANYDIARMRLYGFKPEEGQVLCSLRTGQRLLARAVMTHNVTRSRGAGRDGRQPALVWKQELGQRKLNVIKDVDEFERGIGTVKFMTMNNSGIEMFNRRYTAGAMGMKRLIQDFERALTLKKGDTAPKPKTNTDDRKRPKFMVKIRFDEDDLGYIRVWNPHVQPARWEVFECTDPNTHGMPKWLHDRCLELAEREAMDYLTPEGQAVVRARLFEEIANVDAQAAERERRTLGKALHDPRIRKVMAGYVEIVDEQVEEFGEPQPEEHSPAAHELATGARKDAHIETPRPKPNPAKEPATMRRVATPAAGARDPAAPPPRHAPRKDHRNDDRRNAGAHTESADRPDQRAPTRARSNRLKWGDVM